MLCVSIIIILIILTVMYLLGHLKTDCGSAKWSSFLLDTYTIFLSLLLSMLIIVMTAQSLIVNVCLLF